MGDEYGVRERVRGPAKGADIDIIVVHGLSGHALRTWEGPPPGRKNWVTDPEFLQKDISNARIFTFGYNANLFEDVVASRVVDHADGVLAGLLAFRYECEDRPLIWIGHSLGGIVIKRALVRANNRPEYKPILTATTAITFLGTPHHGSPLADKPFLPIAQKLVAWAKLRHDVGKLVNELTPFSDTLRDITADFTGIASSMTIISFVEQTPTRLPPPEGDQLIVPQGSAVMGHPKESALPLYTTHEGLCKFSSREDSSYFTLIQQLTYLARQSAAKLGEQGQKQIELQISEPAAWLTPQIIVRRANAEYSYRQRTHGRPDENSPSLSLEHEVSLDVSLYTIKKDANVDVRDERSYTPLMYLMKSKHPQAASFAELLLNAGAHLEVANEEGLTPLMLASIKGNLELVKKLLQWGPILDAKSKLGTSALWYATRYGHADIVELLVKDGANIENKTLDHSSNTQTSLSPDPSRSTTPKLGPRPNQSRSGSGDKSDPTKPTFTDNGNLCVVGVAAQMGHTSVLEILLQKHPNLNLQDSKGNTPLLLATEKNQLETVRLLLSHGANFRLQNFDRKGPLTTAAEVDSMPIFKLILAYFSTPQDAQRLGNATNLYPTSAGGKMQYMKLIRQHVARIQKLPKQSGESIEGVPLIEDSNRERIGIGVDDESAGRDISTPKGSEHPTTRDPSPNRNQQVTAADFLSLPLGSLETQPQIPLCNLPPPIQGPIIAQPPEPSEEIEPNIPPPIEDSATAQPPGPSKEIESNGPPSRQGSMIAQPQKPSNETEPSSPTTETQSIYKGLMECDNCCSRVILICAALVTCGFCCGYCGTGC